MRGNIFLTLIAAICLTTSCVGKKGDKTTEDNATANAPVQPAVKPRQNDLKDENLIGKVKYVKRYMYNTLAKTGEPEKAGLQAIDFYTYDINGVKTSENEGNITDTSTYVCKYKYDALGNRIEKDLLTPGDLADSILLFEKTEYVYDTLGNMIKQTRTYRNGVVSDIFLYKYDKAGNKTEQEKYDGYGIGKGRVVYKWDNGVIVESTEFSHSTDPLLVTHCSYKYDKYGNEIECKIKEDNDALKTKYVYDAQGNWVKKVVISNGVSDIEEREIGYYP